MTLTQKPYMTIQMSEIEGHRVWMEGVLEKKVGTERAIASWNRTHESDHYQTVFFDAYHIISEICDVVCHNNCRGVGNCPVDKETWHGILYREGNKMRGNEK